jgi:hypothetical protein
LGCIPSTSSRVPADADAALLVVVAVGGSLVVALERAAARAAVLGGAVVAAGALEDLDVRVLGAPRIPGDGAGGDELEVGPVQLAVGGGAEDLRPQRVRLLVDHDEVGLVQVAGDVEVQGAPVDGAVEHDAGPAKRAVGDDDRLPVGGVLVVDDLVVVEDLDRVRLGLAVALDPDHPVVVPQPAVHVLRGHEAGRLDAGDRPLAVVDAVLPVGLAEAAALLEGSRVHVRGGGGAGPGEGDGERDDEDRPAHGLPWGPAPGKGSLEPWNPQACPKSLAPPRTTFVASA